MRDQDELSAFAGQRIVAALIDVLLWAIILILAALRFGSHTTGPSGASISLPSTPFLMYVGALFASYFLREWWWSRTIGKRLLGLRVVGVDGARIIVVQAFVRNLLRLVDGFPFFLPYLLGLLILAIDPKKRRLGDMLAGTHRAR